MNKILRTARLDALLMSAKSGQLSTAEKLELQQILAGQWQPPKLILIKGGKR